MGRKYRVILGTGDYRTQDKAANQTQPAPIYKARFLVVAMLTREFAKYAARFDGLDEGTRTTWAEGFKLATIGELMGGKIFEWTAPDGTTQYIGIMEDGQAPRDLGKIPGTSAPRSYAPRFPTIPRPAPRERTRSYTPGSYTPPVRKAKPSEAERIAAAMAGSAKKSTE